VEKKKEIQVEQGNAPADLIKFAMTNNSDLEKLERLLVLQERYEANEAKKAYHIAMADFKANPPEINKDRHVNYSTQKGKVEYKHASLFNVTEKINSELSKYGLSATWSMNQTNGSVTVSCIITHAKGHSESTSLTASPDTTGSKNAIQAIGSTISYLQRYTLLSLTGLATCEQDDDAVAKAEEEGKPQAMAQNGTEQAQNGNLPPQRVSKLTEAQKLQFKGFKLAIGQQDFFYVLKKNGYKSANDIPQNKISEIMGYMEALIEPADNKDQEPE